MPVVAEVVGSGDGEGDDGRESVNGDSSSMWSICWVAAKERGVFSSSSLRLPTSMSSAQPMSASRFRSSAGMTVPLLAFNTPSLSSMTKELEPISVARKAMGPRAYLKGRRYGLVSVMYFCESNWYLHPSTTPSRLAVLCRSDGSGLESVLKKGRCNVHSARTWPGSRVQCQEYGFPASQHFA